MIDGADFHIENVKKLPPLPNDHMCFGAGPANHYGLRMNFSTDNKRIYSKLNIPTHMNSWIGLVHGGVVSTVLDEIMFYTALFFFRCFALTKEVHVKLHRPTKFEQMPVIAIGEVKARDTDTNGQISSFLYKGNAAAQ